MQQVLRPSVLVLGAGIAGVSAALHLQQAGLDVALIDRDTACRGASFGNAGIIQAEAMEPYAMPRGLSVLGSLTLFGGYEVRLALASLPRLAGPLLRYWWHSAPVRHAAASRHYAKLVARATQEHAPLIEASGADALIRRDGFRSVFRSQAALDAELRYAAALGRDFGVATRALTAAELAAAEPGLTRPLAGAIHWLDPWTVRDPGALVAAYTDLFLKRGGTFARGDALTLAGRARAGWTVATDDGAAEGEAAVVALGALSPSLLARHGLHIPLIPKRGYHRHYPEAANRVDLPFLDAERGYVAAPMTRGLRLTTGADIALPGARPCHIQLRRAEAAARDLLDLGPPEEAAAWQGTRPCMPDMLPVIGDALPGRGLWACFGHGHQGLTLGPATGRLLAELMTGGDPFTDPAPYAPQRFR
ncbi:MAG: FAD-binding oxidoreductase [Rhodospirillaceae bacterium]|nr:FAD-binding oxidoreductase [Rhodospirillaceae bacterium]